MMSLYYYYYYLIKKKLVFHNNLNYTYSGLYKLKCSCNKFYIGRTNKDFSTRYKEHISENKLYKNYPKSNFAKYMY